MQTYKSQQDGQTAQEPTRWTNCPGANKMDKPPRSQQDGRTNHTEPTRQANQLEKPTRWTQAGGANELEEPTSWRSQPGGGTNEPGEPTRRIPTSKYTQRSIFPTRAERPALPSILLVFKPTVTRQPDYCRDIIEQSELNVGIHQVLPGCQDMPRAYRTFIIKMTSI